MLGNCLGDKNYLRWANKFPSAQPSPPQKSETVSEVPNSIHESRYRAMGEKQREPTKVPVAPVVSDQSKLKAEDPPAASVPIGKPTSSKSSFVPVEPGVNTTAELQESDCGGASESERAKLERKRRQQQKKEEFLQQLKRHKSDENAPSVPIVKSEAPSPIPEGWFLFVFLCESSRMFVCS